MMGWRESRSVTWLPWFLLLLFLFQGDEGVDAAALEFLEEAEAKDLEVEYMALVRSGFSKSERMREVVRRRHVLRQKGRGRKKKKRKRMKLRKSSSLHSSCGVRIRRCGQGFRSRSSWSGALLLSPGLRCSASWPVCTRRTDSSCARRHSWQWHVQSWFYWLFCTSCCFFSSSCRLALVLGILAGMDHIVSYVVVPMVQTAENCEKSAVAVHQGRRHFRPGAQAEVVDVPGMRSYRSPQVVHTPVVCNDRCPPQLQFINKVVIFPFVAQRHIQMVKLFNRPLRFHCCRTHGG